MKEQTTQQRIMDAAFELIYANSYAEVGVAAICERAGVQKGSFYHHFKSKQDLAMAVLEQNFCDFKSAMLDAVFTGERDGLTEIQDFVDQIYEYQKDIKTKTGQVLGCPFGNMSIELSTQDEAIRKKLVHIFQRSKESLREALQRGVDEHDERLENIDADATAQAMYAYLEGILMSAKTHNDIDVYRQLAPALLDIRIHAKTH